MPIYGSENFFEIHCREIPGLNHERKRNTESKANDRITEDADFDVNVGEGGAERLISTLEKDDRFEFVTKNMEPAPTPKVEEVKQGGIFSVKRTVDDEEYKIDVSSFAEKTPSKLGFGG